MKLKGLSSVTISTPYLVDKAIQEIQTVLSGLSWLGVVYGIAEKRYTDLGAIPVAYQGNGVDEQDLRPNDHMKSIAFFDVQDPVRFSYDDYNSISKYSKIEVDCSLIVSAKLDRLTTSDFREYRTARKRELIEYLQRKMFKTKGIIDLTNMYEKDLEDIYRGYTVTDLNRKFYMLPWWHLRIDFTLRINEPCTS